MLEIQDWLQDTFAALPNHNYGWWITTREHLDVAALVTATQFIYGRFGLKKAYFQTRTTTAFKWLWGFKFQLQEQNNLSIDTCFSTCGGPEVSRADEAAQD